MVFVYDGVFSFPSCPNASEKKADPEGSRCGRNLFFYRQFCTFITRLLITPSGNDVVIRTSAWPVVVGGANGDSEEASGVVYCLCP